MGNYYGGGIVTQGLVLALDASTDRSYPGSGTTWTDISGNGYNGTLVNGATHFSGSIKSVNLDGSTQYVDCGDVEDLGDNFTVSVWTKYTGTLVTYNPLIFRDGNTDYNFGLRVDSSAFVEFRQYNGDEVRTGGPIPQETWVNIVGTVNDLTASVFINGYQTGSSSIFTNSYNDTGNIRLGIYSLVPNWYYTGSFGSALIYNRALSSKEVLQNYNATKGRFF